MSDDEEGEYNTVTSAWSGGKGVKLLYSKSKVFVHPTKSAKDNIPGFIALIQQKSTPGALESEQSDRPASAAANKLLLAWVPESTLGSSYDTYVKVDLSDSASPPKQTYLVPAPPITTHAASSGLGAYAFSTPVSNIYSLLVRPPSIGWWYGSVVINTRAGDSFPALFFHDDECQSTILQRKKLARESFDPFQDGQGMFWGGDEVLRWLKRYVRVERAGADPNVFLVEPTDDDRKGFSKVDSERKKVDQQASHVRDGSKDGAMDPITKIFKETKWNILEKLAQVTTFTRRTAQSISENPRMPNQFRTMMRNPEVQNLQDEYDSARIYLARWAMQIAEQSDKEKNQRVWSAKDVLELESTGVGDFEILENDVGRTSLQERRKPIDQAEWDSFFDSKGYLQLTVDEVKEKVFHGGFDAEDGVRKEAWLFLLGVYDWHSSKKERQASTNSLRDEYIKLKGRWWEKMVEGAGTPEQKEKWREERNRIEKDVHRTDRHIAIFEGEDIPHPDADSPFADIGTNVHLEQMKDMLLTYNEYNTDLGYVQGMSDLLSPIYAVMQDDAIAFWAFVKFMDRMQRNFLRDQSGMRLQLLTLDHLVQFVDPQLYIHLEKANSTNFFFFFRMLLVWYKREFSWPNVLRLWEVLWTDYLSYNFHIFIALAILEKHRSVIMDHLHEFDVILKYSRLNLPSFFEHETNSAVNELSNTIDLDATLLKAEALFQRFARMVEAVDKKHSFPAPRPAADRSSSSYLNSPFKSPTSPITDPRATPALLRDAGRRPSKSTEEATADQPSSPSPQQLPVQDSVPGSKAKGKTPVRRGQQQEEPVKKGPVTDVVSEELRALLKRGPPVKVDGEAAK
jgi:hypothetical protein